MHMHACLAVQAASKTGAGAGSARTSADSPGVGRASGGQPAPAAPACLHEDKAPQLPATSASEVAPDPKDAEALILIQKCGGVAGAVALLRGSDSDQSRAARALAAFGRNGGPVQNALDIVRAGAVPALLDCLSSTLEEARCHAASALHALAWGDKECTTRLMAAVDQLLASLADSSAQVQTEVARTLWRMGSADDECMAAFATAGAAQHLVACIFNSCEDRKWPARFACLHVLEALAKHGAQHKSIAAAALEELNTRMAEDSEQRRLSAVEALLAVAGRRQKLASALADTGAFKQVTACLADTSQVMQIGVAKALAKFVKVRVKRKRLLEGATAPVVAMLACSLPDVQEAAAQLMCSLVTDDEKRRRALKAACGPECLFMLTGTFGKKLKELLC